MGVPTAFAILALGLSFLKTPVYTATATLLPRNQNISGGLVSQFLDQSLLASNENQLEPFFRDILLSNRLLDNAISRKWSSYASGDSVNLFDIFGISWPRQSEGDSSRAVEKLKRKLRQDVVAFSREKTTGLMRIGCTFPEHPGLAADFCNYLIGELDAFTIDYRTGKASEQSEFIEERLTDVKTELDSAANTLASFVEANRLYQSSPSLTQRYNELSREVEAQTAVWIELRRQLEMARIDARKQLVSLDVLDSATPPTHRARPVRSQYMLLGFFMGLIAAVLAILALGMHHQGA